MSATISRGFALRASIRAATRRPFSRPQLVRASQRAYSSSHPQIPESSNTPWLIGSVVFTVVGLAGILMPGSSQSKAPSHTQHTHDPEPVQEATTESEPEQTLEVLEPKPEAEEKPPHEEPQSQPNDASSEAKSVQSDGGSDSEATNTPGNSGNEDAKKDGEKPVPEPEPEAKEEPSKETKAE